MDRSIAELAACQHGVVTREQLIRAGATLHAVYRRVAAGWLRPIHRGVYQVGPVVAPRTAEMAAVLACGDGAVLSHRSAARLWRMVSAGSRSGPVEVTVRGSGRRRPGVRVHRVRALPPDEETRIDGIPVTTPVRTLLDLAGAVDRRDLERALARADRRGLTGRKKILALLARHPRRPGAAALRACLRADASPALTRSRAEEEFLDLARRAQFRAPEANVVIEGYEVDFLWRAERLVVEVDGFAYHGSRRTFERDRRRDAVLAARGYHVMRVTWRQLGTEPEAVVARLAQALARAGHA